MRLNWLAESKKQPKKLKDVKINPAVAATFANLSITPAASSGSLGKGCGACLNLLLLAGYRISQQVR